MVERTEASAVVILHEYRNFNYLDMYRELQKKFPHLEKIFLFDDEVPEGAPEGTYSLTQLAQAAAEKPIEEDALKARRLDPIEDVALLTTTSGTTGIPKLVEWPTAPRVCTSKGRVDIWNLTKDDITMAIAPHAGGAAGTLTNFAAPLAGAKTVMLEEFDPEAALVGARIHSEDGRLVEFDGLQFDPVTTSGGYADRPPGPEPRRPAA